MLGSIGVRFMVAGADSGDGSHSSSIQCRHEKLAAHSTATAGRLNTASSLREESAPLLGDEVVYGHTGDLIFKPRGQWHAFWNAGDEPARNSGDHLSRGLRAVLRRALGPAVQPTHPMRMRLHHSPCAMGLRWTLPVCRNFQRILALSFGRDPN